MFDKFEIISKSLHFKALQLHHLKIGPGSTRAPTTQQPSRDAQSSCGKSAADENATPLVGTLELPEQHPSSSPSVSGKSVSGKQDTAQSVASSRQLSSSHHSKQQSQHSEQQQSEQQQSEQQQSEQESKQEEERMTSRSATASQVASVRSAAASSSHHVSSHNDASHHSKSTQNETENGEQEEAEQAPDNQPPATEKENSDELLAKMREREKQKQARIDKLWKQGGHLAIAALQQEKEDNPESVSRSLPVLIIFPKVDSLNVKRNNLVEYYEIFKVAGLLHHDFVMCRVLNHQTRLITSRTDSQHLSK